MHEPMTDARLAEIQSTATPVATSATRYELAHLDVDGWPVLIARFPDGTAAPTSLPPIWQDWAAFAVAAPTIVPELLAEVARLRGGEVTVYRAVYGPEDIPLGTYTNAAAAREHCEDFARMEERSKPGPLQLTWRLEDDEADDEAGPMEALWVTVDGEESDTGYVVIPVQVDDQYDPDADR